jgi:hypothetical protein
MGNEIGEENSKHGREKNGYIFSENVKERDAIEDLHVNGRIILKWILKKQDVKVLTGFIWLRIGTSSGFLWTQ